MRRAGVRAGVVIGHQDQIGRAVVLERCAEGDGRPRVGGHGDTTAEHLVAGGDRDPVSLAGEVTLRRRLQVEFVGAGLRGTTVIEGYCS